MVKSISINWHIEDVLSQAKKMNYRLNENQASDILLQIKNGHDCNIGINWDVIDIYIISYCADNDIKKIVFNISYFEVDEQIDSTHINELDEALIWDLFKEFGHERTPVTRYEYEEVFEDD